MRTDDILQIPADTLLAEELASEDVVEMANLTTAQTGVPGTILISTAMGGHGPRVKYFLEPGRPQPSFSVTVSDAPVVVANSLPRPVPPMHYRHPRESGGPGQAQNLGGLDFRLRGNDEVGWFLTAEATAMPADAPEYAFEPRVETHPDVTPAKAGAQGHLYGSAHLGCPLARA